MGDSNLYKVQCVYVCMWLIFTFSYFAATGPTGSNGGGGTTDGGGTTGGGGGTTNGGTNDTPAPTVTDKGGLGTTMGLPLPIVGAIVGGVGMLVIICCVGTTLLVCFVKTCKHTRGSGKVGEF